MQESRNEEGSRAKRDPRDSFVEKEYEIGGFFKESLTVWKPERRTNIGSKYALHLSRRKEEIPVKLRLIFLLCAYSSADMHASQTALSTTFGNHKVSLGMSVDDSLRALVQDFDVVLQSGDTVSGTTIWDVWQKSPRVLVGAISIKDRLVVQIDRQWVEGNGNASSSLFDAFYARARVLEAESDTLCVLTTASEQPPETKSAKTVSAVTLLCGCSHPPLNVARESLASQEQKVGS